MVPEQTCQTRNVNRAVRIELFITRAALQNVLRKKKKNSKEIRTNTLIVLIKNATGMIKLFLYLCIFNNLLNFMI